MVYQRKAYFEGRFMEQTVLNMKLSKNYERFGFKAEEDFYGTTVLSR